MENPFIPHYPTPKQAAFLSLTDTESFYGGAAGGGKSNALLMAGLQFVDQPGYAALILRKTFADLSKPGALIPRSMEWLGQTGAQWVGSSHLWKFPSGAVIQFGYLDTDMDKYQYQSSEFQYIGFDELSHFRESDYRYMFSRLRRLKSANIPLRMRSGSNPGGSGHDWVKRRFIIEGLQNGRIFIPAKLDDNPHIDRQEYLKSLSHLDPVTRAQLERGDWSARKSGSMFKREWFEVVGQAPSNPGQSWVRFWDLAATEQKDSNDPDWSCGALLTVFNGVWYLRDMRRFRTSPKGNEDIIRQTAAIDPIGTSVRMEQEPGASGKSLIDHYARNVLVGYSFQGIPSLREKVLRAGPFSSSAQAGNFKLVQGQWIGDFLDEIEAFPDGSHDDQTDAVSGAMGVLTTGLRNLTGFAQERTLGSERMEFQRLSRSDF